MTYIQKWYQFCPHCKSILKSEDDLMASCENCSFTFYHNPAPCVSVLILNEDRNQVLLAKRAIDPARGKWDVVGGFIEKEESAEEAVIRETKEETGLTVEIIDFWGTLSDIYGKTMEHTLSLIYTVKIKEGKALAQDDVAQLKWFSWKNLPDPSQIAFKSVAQALSLVATHPRFKIR